MSGAVRVRALMNRSARSRLTVMVATGVVGTGLMVSPLSPPVAAATSSPVLDSALARSPELSETSRLAERRFVVTGDKAWELGTADGRYPAAGFHTRGEMGGFWTPSLKLLDGMWFGINGRWIGAGTKTTSGWGYVRTDLPATDGVAASRTDFVPDGVSGSVIGLSLRSATSKTITITQDAHSELISSYPWGESTPSQSAVNLPDTASYGNGALHFVDRGTPPNSNGESHNWAAAVGSTLTPTAHQTGTNFRGPQGVGTLNNEPRPVICPASGPDTPTQPDYCDDTAYGKGAGGQLSYRIRLKAGEVRTVWFAVGGSTSGKARATAELGAALRNPAAALAHKVADRRQVERYSHVDLPGDPLLSQSVAWSKQMLAASVQQSDDLKLRVTNAGKNYPKPVGTLPSIRWIGAGWPDYTWLFGTDGEYTGFAAVAAGQFEAIEDHLYALRNVSNIVNNRSGKIVHEVTPDGSVYFGANADAGNTDETAKFPSAVALVWRWSGNDRFLSDMYPSAVRAMHYIDRKLDADHDGWPEGLGNVETAGLGDEKLDNAVYTVRGYADLADLAKARGDKATQKWATGKAHSLINKFEHDWWYGKDGAKSYADSLKNPGNTQVFQRHWIGLTPTDAMLPKLPGRAAGPLASRSHGNTTLTQHEGPCFTAELGLYHTGTGPTSAEGGNMGATCDSVVSQVQSLRSIFTLNSAIAGVSEGNFGRLGADQQGVYTTGNARAQLDPSIWEMPGAMPEIVPGGDFGANIDKLFTERSMVMQAWGAYGTIWPVIHQWLGVSPDAGRNRVTVVPQLPPGERRAAGSKIRIGQGSVDVTTTHVGKRYASSVTRHGKIRLTLGVLLPAKTKIAGATLNGHRIKITTTRTDRGLEATTTLGSAQGTSRLVVITR